MCLQSWCWCDRQKVDEQKAEIERLEHILDGKVEAEKKNIGNFSLLGSRPKVICGIFLLNNNSNNKIIPGTMFVVLSLWHSLWEFTQFVLFIYLFIYSIYQSTVWNSKNNMHQINTIPELNGQCKDSPLKHGQHKW